MSFFFLQRFFFAPFSVSSLLFSFYYESVIASDKAGHESETGLPRFDQPADLFFTTSPTGPAYPVYTALSSKAFFQEMFPLSGSPQIPFQIPA